MHFKTLYALVIYNFDGANKPLHLIAEVFFFARHKCTSKIKFILKTWVHPTKFLATFLGAFGKQLQKAPIELLISARTV
jgi:hypothetical protein